LQLLRESRSPLAHAAVADHLAATGVDKATAFRNLNDMTEAGLLRRTEVGDHVWRFEATKGGLDHDPGHPHFLCVDCGSVSCLDDVKLTLGSQRESQKVGEVTEILLRGHCNDCR
jgi:Fur family ferric uptake transcriptional regulator